MDGILLGALALTVGLLAVGGLRLRRILGDAATARVAALDRLAASLGGGRARATSWRARVLDEELEIDEADGSTVIRARAAGAGDIRLRIAREDFFLSRLRESVGFDYLATGKPAFDVTFRVRTTDHDLAAAWLDAEAQLALLGAPDFCFAVGNGQVTVTRFRLESDMVALERAIRAAASLARGGRRLLDRWLTAARVLGATVPRAPEAWTLDLRVAMELQLDGATVTIDPHRSAPDAARPVELRTYTRVHAPRLAHAVHAAHAAVEPALSPAIQFALDAAAPARVMADDDGVALLLAGIVTDPRRLEDAARVAAARAAGGGTGLPYR